MCWALAEKAAADATAKVEKAGQEAKATVERAGEKAKSEVASVAASAASLQVGDIDLGKNLVSLMEGLKGTLGGVKDAPTAQAALPKLEEGQPRSRQARGTRRSAACGGQTSLGKYDQDPCGHNH